jgi:alcohol dehydrogenase (cytochrome c)
VSWKTVGALAVALAGTSLNSAWSETTGDTAKAMGAPASPVSQEQLNAAAKDENNFLQTNGNYEQTRYFPDQGERGGQERHGNPNQKDKGQGGRPSR